MFYYYCCDECLHECQCKAFELTSKIEIWNFAQMLNSWVPKSWSLIYGKQNSFDRVMSLRVWCAWLYSLQELIFLVIIIIIRTYEENHFYIKRQKVFGLCLLFHIQTISNIASNHLHNLYLVTELTSRILS